MPSDRCLHWLAILDAVQISQCFDPGTRLHSDQGLPVSVQSLSFLERLNLQSVEHVAKSCKCIMKTDVRRECATVCSDRQSPDIRRYHTSGFTCKTFCGTIIKPDLDLQPGVLGLRFDIGFSKSPAMNATVARSKGSARLQEQKHATCTAYQARGFPC